MVMVYSPEAHAIAQTFYPHQMSATWDSAQEELSRRLAWHDKLGQAEVDYLIEKGRLRVLAHCDPDDPEASEFERKRGSKWISMPRTAAEINEINRSVSLDGHDAINRILLVEFRCKQLGIELYCEFCSGHGNLATDEQREAAENWEHTDPPVGDAYQLWEKVSEGSPISRPFASKRDLANWLAGYSDLLGQKLNVDEWLEVIEDNIIGTDIHTGDLVRSGHEG